jgi:glycosyltransferase involved in cell wall biosynthesis
MVIYCSHGWLFSRPGGGPIITLVKLGERFLAWFTDSILCISDDEKRLAMEIGIPERKCPVIKNGIAELVATSSHAKGVMGKGDDRLKILFVGRFDYQKGFDLYLEVLRQLRDIADGAAIGSFMIDRTTELQIPSNVVTLCWRTREAIAQALAEFDLILVPSRQEGFGLVAVEAMRGGLPVFASRVGGLKEIVVDHVTGRLFDCENVGQIVQIIRSTSRTSLRDYGRSGEARFRSHFTSGQMNARILSHYRALVRSAAHLDRERSVPTGEA